LTIVNNSIKLFGMSGTTLSISLPDNLRNYVDQRVASGSFGNTSEFFRDMLRRDQLEQEKTRFRSLIEDGLVSGGLRAVTPELISEIESQVFGTSD
jgi:antitoxin ParD1/3/4